MTIEKNNTGIGFLQGGEGMFLGKSKKSLLAETTITQAEMIALFTTPITIIPAPGAGFAVVPRLIHVIAPAGTAFSGIAAGEDVAISYTDASGAECAPRVETTGFLDQATLQNRLVPCGAVQAVLSSIVPVANAVVVAHMLVGNIAAGRAVTFRTEYDVIKLSV